MHPTTRAERTLNDLVVNTELTLISIIQGVALYFLTDTTRQALIQGNYYAYLYAATGLLIILLFWSRSIIHTFTVIRWPLEFGHNFLYIACTFVEALMFTMILDVRWWYIVALAYSLSIWGLYAFDLRMIRNRAAGTSVGSHEKMFLKILIREQEMMMWRVMPAGVLFFGAATFCMVYYRDYFIAQQGHLWFAIPQLLGAIANIAYVMAFYRRITPLILRMRAGEV